MTRRVALVSGGWGQNIGNAFFNLGGRHVLESAGLDVSFVQDMPAYATFRNERRGNYSNAFPILDHLDVDLLVLQGPLFTVNFANIWQDQLRRLAARGVGWAAIGAAFRAYDDAERTVARDLLTRIPPRFVSTRDRWSSDALAGLGVPVRNGIDSAFFVPLVFNPPSSASRLVAFTFDHFGEPTLVDCPDGPIVVGDRRFRAQFDETADKAARRSKAHAIARRALQRGGRRPATINGHTIVRPDHRTNPHLPFTIYKDPNAIASDEPWTYLTVYANSQFTYSDRVHACVVTLAYGRPAMLHNPTTRRSALFESVGCQDIGSRPQLLDRGRLDGEFDAVVRFVADEMA